MAGMPSKTARLAVLTAAALGAAVAACSFTLGDISTQQANANGRYWIQLTPGQDFTPSDGRAMDVPAWRINAAIATQVIGRFDATQPPVIDYEHQTLHKEANGQPAPAAGWIHGLRWAEGSGLFAEVEFTARALQAIASGEYRYFSPVFLYAEGTGEVLKVTMGALTNHPAIHGMQALNAMQAAASAQFSTTTAPTEEPMLLLKALLAVLGLPDSTTEQAALTAVQTHKDVAEAARTALVLKAEDGATAVAAACSALTAKAPDPAKFVPVETVTAMQGQLAALTAQAHATEVDKLIQPALADGRLLPAMEPWARDLGKTNMAALTAYLQTAQPVAALTSTQTGGKAPAALATGAHGLSQDELAACSAMGVDPEAFAKTKAES
ncbi:putative Mu-like prophage I protein [Comamonas sp. E6]|nr:putative Mu-like prophage I protein [Comamonas sp. E6]